MPKHYFSKPLEAYRSYECSTCTDLIAEGDTFYISREAGWDPDLDGLKVCEECKGVMERTG